MGMCTPATQKVGANGGRVARSGVERGWDGHVHAPLGLELRARGRLDPGNSAEDALHLECHRTPTALASCHRPPTTLAAHFIARTPMNRCEAGEVTRGEAGVCGQ